MGHTVGMFSMSANYAAEFGTLVLKNVPTYLYNTYDCHYAKFHKVHIKYFF